MSLSKRAWDHLADNFLLNPQTPIFPVRLSASLRLRMAGEDVGHVRGGVRHIAAPASEAAVRGDSLRPFGQEAALGAVLRAIFAFDRQDFRDTGTDELSRDER